MYELERYDNVSYPYIFRKEAAPGESGILTYGLTSHGFVTRLTVIIPAGDGGKLHIRPYVELPGEIIQDLCKYAADNFLSGDDVVYKLDCYQEIENHAVLKIEYNNTETDPTSDNAQIMVDVIVQYDSIIQPKNVIG